MNLSKVVQSFGVLTIINFARKHADKLAQCGVEALVPLAEAVRAAASELEAALGARMPLQSVWSAAAQRKDALDDALDAFIAAMSYDLLGPQLLKGDRSSAAYRAIFTAGNLDFLRAPERSELALVNGMVLYLKANPDHPMAGRAAELEAKAQALSASLEPVVAAETALRAAQALEKEKRESLGRVLRKSAAIARAELMDEKKVFALFPTIAEAQVKEDATTTAG
jgi:hypothetical protein